MSALNHGGATGGGGSGAQGGGPARPRASVGAAGPRRPGSVGNAAGKFIIYTFLLLLIESDER